MPSKNPEVIARARQRFAERHPDYQKQWHAENPDKRKKYQTKYESASQEKIREKGRRYYAANRDKLRTRQAEYRKKHPEKAAERQMRAKFGIGLAEKEQMWLAQNKCCKICQKSVSLLSAHIDHDHAIGPMHIRGLLCVNCNIGLGSFKDSPTLLVTAAMYLQTFQDEIDADL